MKINLTHLTAMTLGLLCVCGVGGGRRSNGGYGTGQE